MTSQNSQDIIICEGVKKWFGDFQALRGITTTVAEGEVVVVFGPSGSGKSTFIRTLNRLEEHDEGQSAHGFAEGSPARRASARESRRT